MEVAFREYPSPPLPLASHYLSKKVDVIKGTGHLLTGINEARAKIGRKCFKALPSAPLISQLREISSRSLSE
jgi:hypothetical protein